MSKTRLFLVLISIAVAGAFSTVRADEVPVCEYLWGVTPQICSTAFESSQAASSNRCELRESPTWGKNMWNVDTDTDSWTPFFKDYLEKFKAQSSPEGCACHLKFKCRESHRRNLDNTGIIHFFEERQWHHCDNILPSNIKRLAVDGNGVLLLSGFCARTPMDSLY